MSSPSTSPPPIGSPPPPSILPPTPSLFAPAHQAKVHWFFDADSCSVTYICYCPTTRNAMIIDPVWQFDLHTGKFNSELVDSVISFVKDRGLIVQYIVETQLHTTHITAAKYLRDKMQIMADTGISEEITKQQTVFKRLFNLEVEFLTEGTQWTHLWGERDNSFQVGTLRVDVIKTPGHSSTSVSYYVHDDCVFVGDALLMPDVGSSRADGPAGSAVAMWDSAQKLFELPGFVRCFVGHDYAPLGRPYQWETTIQTQIDTNKHLKRGTVQQYFIEWRNQRDSHLPKPRMYFPAVQLNIRCGELPPQENSRSETVYLKIPIDDGRSSV